jgi:hypothetical protein
VITFTAAGGRSLSTTSLTLFEVILSSIRPVLRPSPAPVVCGNGYQCYSKDVIGGLRCLFSWRSLYCCGARLLALLGNRLAFRLLARRHEFERHCFLGHAAREARHRQRVIGCVPRLLVAGLAAGHLSLILFAFWY